MVWTPSWTGWLRGTHGLDLMGNFLTERRAVKLLVVRAIDILASRLLFPQEKKRRLLQFTEKILYPKVIT